MCVELLGRGLLLYLWPIPCSWRQGHRTGNICTAETLRTTEGEQEATFVQWNLHRGANTSLGRCAQCLMQQCGVSEWVGVTHLVTGVSVLCTRFFLERMQTAIMAEVRQVHVP